MAIRDKDQSGTGTRILTVDANGNHGNSSGVPLWTKVATVSKTDLSAGALTNSYAAYSLPARGIIEGVGIEVVTAFTGSFSSYQVSLGISGSEDLYISLFDAMQAPGASSFLLMPQADVRSLIAATSILISATAVGANLSTALTGSLRVFLKLSTLPS